MAKQTEVVEILLKLSDGNTIPLMGKKAKKAKKEMEGLGKASQGTDRRIKGVTQQSSNASKNFSKQAQTMQGGIVAVYATIAAQVFAVSAAFQFLKDAMETRNLIEGQLAFGAVTGVAYKTLTTNIQAAAGGMIQFREAAQAAAIGTAGGLSAHQLERLGSAALNTSLALGRDLTDSFNRLVRGVTKAEPELLDELGIILRLEPALKNYAALIGKAVKDLNQFEKSQAIANEVLDQAESKFGMMSLLMDDSAFALQQFQKSFDDVMNNLKKWVGDVAGKVLPFFTDNIMNLVGAIGLFLAPILKSLLPDFKAMAVAKRAQADEHIFQLEREKAALDSYKAKRAEVGNLENKLRAVAEPELAAASSKVGVSGGVRGKARMIKHYETQTTQLIKGEIKKRTGALAAASPKDVAILKQKYLNMNKATASWSAKTKAQFTSITNWGNVQWARLKVGWQTTMTGMARIGQGFAKIMNVAMRAMGWASIILMIYQGIKALREWRQGVDEARKAEIDFYQTVEDRYKGLRVEFIKMQEARRRGFVMGENIISQTGKVLQSVDIPKLLADWNLLMQTKPQGLDKEATEGWERAVVAQRNAMMPLLAMTNEMQEVENTGIKNIISSLKVSQLGKNLELGIGDIVGDEDIKAVTRWANEWIEAGNFIDLAAERNKTLAKSIQEVANAAGSEKFARVLDEAYGSYQGLLKRPKQNDAVDAIQESLLEQRKQRKVGAEEHLERYLAEHDPTGEFKALADLDPIRYNEQTSANQRLGVNWVGENSDIPFNKMLGDYDVDDTFGQKVWDSFAGAGENLGGLDRFRREYYQLKQTIVDMVDEVTNIEEGMVKWTETTTKNAAELAVAERNIKAIWELQKNINKFDKEKIDIAKDTIKLNDRLMSFNDTTTKNHKEDLKLRTAINNGVQKTNNLQELTTSATLQDLDFEKGIATYKAGNWKELFGNYTKEERSILKKIMFAREEIGLSELKIELTREQRAEQKILNDMAWEDKKLSYEQAISMKKIARLETKVTHAKEKAVGFDQERLVQQQKIRVSYTKALKTFDKMVQAEKNYQDYTAKRTETVDGKQVTLANNLEKVAELEKKRMENAQEYLNLMMKITAESYKQSGAGRLSDIEDETSRGQTKFSSKYGDGEGRFGRGFGVKGAWKSGLNIQGRAYAEERGNMGYDTDAAMIAGERIKMIAAEQAKSIDKKFSGQETVDPAELEAFVKSWKLTDEASARIDVATGGLPANLRAATDAASSFKVELDLAKSIETTIENGFVSMFQAMIDGTQSFGDAMKDLMKQVLADLAAAYMKAAALKMMMAMGFSTPGARYGGELNGPARYGGELTGPGYAIGGIAAGPTSGYQATLHGREAVVPLGNDRSIPVDIRGASGNTVNVSISMQGGQSQTSVAGGGDMQALGRSIGGLVQQHLQTEMRPGGLLNRQGAKGRV